MKSILSNKQVKYKLTLWIRTKQINGSLINIKEENHEMLLFTDICDGSKNGESKKITKHAKDKLVDPNIKSYFGNHMIPSIKQLHHRHGRVCLPSIPLPQHSVGCHVSLWKNQWKENEKTRALKNIRLKREDRDSLGILISELWRALSLTNLKRAFRIRKDIGQGNDVIVLW